MGILWIFYRIWLLCEYFLINNVLAKTICEIRVSSATNEDPFQKSQFNVIHNIIPYTEWVGMCSSLWKRESCVSSMNEIDSLKTKLSAIPILIHLINSCEIKVTVWIVHRSPRDIVKDNTIGKIMYHCVKK